MFEGYSPFSVEVESGVTIRGLHAGPGFKPSAPVPTLSTAPAPDQVSSPMPLLLLHGFPQTHRCWHAVAGPLLEAGYTVVIPDLRGYGESTKPTGPGGGHAHGAYSKSVMARDCVRVMDVLLGSGDWLHPSPSSSSSSSSPPPPSFFICAHDRGARVAHKLCVDHPTRVRRAILLDISPTLTMYERTNMEFACRYFHWFFLTQPSPFPETLMGAAPGVFAAVTLGTRPLGALGGAVGGLLSRGSSQEDKAKEVFGNECVEAYTAGFRDPATAHGMCEDYRASASIDLDEARADLAAGRRIQCDMRVLWGRQGVIELLFDCLNDWRAVSDGKVEGYVVESGHYIPDEVPEEVLRNILEFLRD